MQIGYSDGTFKEYYIEQYEDDDGCIIGKHVIDDLTNVLVVMVSITEPHLSNKFGLPGDFKGLLVEELKTKFLRSLNNKYFLTTQDLCTPPELEDVKANFDKVLAGLTKEKFSLTTQPPPTL